MGEKSKHILKGQCALQGQWNCADTFAMYPAVNVLGDRFILYKKDKSNIDLNFEQKNNNVLVLMNENEANIYDTLNVLNDSIVIFKSLYHDRKILKYQKSKPRF